MYARARSGCLLAVQISSVLAVFQRGLQGAFSIEVRHAALLASVGFITAADAPHQLSQLLYPMLETLPALAQHTSLSIPATTPSPPLSSDDDSSYYSNLSEFLATLTPLCSSHPYLFQPHLPALLTFLPPLILPTVGAGLTPTVGRPFPSHSSAGATENCKSVFAFPPSSASRSAEVEADADAGRGDEGDDEKSTLRLSVPEFMVSLSEAKASMVKKVPGWTDVTVRACLEEMGELDDDALDVWLRQDPSAESSSAEAESPPALYEQSLDRLATSLCMPPSTSQPAPQQYIPSMLASCDWRARHAGLMAIAAIGEGTGRVMQHELEKIVEMVVPMFRDTHPRVGMQLVNASLINFCEGVERDTLAPYLDPIVERLLKLHNPGQGRPVHSHVQDADASEVTFATHYSTIMPLLLDILRNADGPEYHKLRIKAMECVGLIVLAVATA
ncbi:armadillo-type protein [Amanita rubescens]|nr:armadillo-type protein [Amanita rubescens]